MLFFVKSSLDPIFLDSPDKRRNQIRSPVQCVVSIRLHTLEFIKNNHDLLNERINGIRFYRVYTCLMNTQCYVTDSFLCSNANRHLLLL